MQTCFYFKAMIIDSDQLKKKMARYCAWRERYTGETEQKLIQLGASAKQIKELLQWLMDENYLNDLRFANAFAKGKFSNNQWGKYRIIAELKARNIHPDFITQAMESIEDSEYIDTALRLAQKKWREIKDVDLFVKKQKTASYIAGKGFETTLAWKIAEQMEKQQND